MKYVASKDQKTFMNDLKPVYKADTPGSCRTAAGRTGSQMGAEIRKGAITSDMAANNETFRIG